MLLFAAINPARELHIQTGLKCSILLVEAG